jgi:hypothetical protein
MPRASASTTLLLRPSTRISSLILSLYYSANNARPKDAYFFTIGVKTQSTAHGDATDFDATTIDPDSILAGPNLAPNNAEPLHMDFDGDTDIIFGFRMEDTGIDCLDNTVTLAGTDLSGNPLAGSDLIATINCEEPTTIDVDPWNSANEVDPDQDYTLPVAIFSTKTAAGEPSDIDALQVDISSLGFGPNQSPHQGSRIVTDLDGDGDSDIVVGFNPLDSGLACGDTELQIEGQLSTGLPIIGADTITTVECSTNGCHP